MLMPGKKRRLHTELRPRMYINLTESSCFLLFIYNKLCCMWTWKTPEISNVSFIQNRVKHSTNTIANQEFLA